MNLINKAKFQQSSFVTPQMMEAVKIQIATRKFEIKELKIEKVQTEKSLKKDM